MTYLELLQKIDYYKTQISTLRPMQTAELSSLNNYYKIGNTYASNALEGNTLTLTETKILLEDGITVHGKPIKDCFETIGHGKAFDYMIDIAKDTNLIITEDMIKELHRLFYAGVDEAASGVYRDVQVFISGTEYMPPSPTKVPIEMNDLVQYLSKNKDMHPVQLGTMAHKMLVDIHPFVDGNGRTARLLMNLIFINKGYQVVSISPILRAEYISALKAAQREVGPTYLPFLTFTAECVIEEQKALMRMLKLDTKYPDLGDGDNELEL